MTSVDVRKKFELFLFFFVEFRDVFQSSGLAASILTSRAISQTLNVCFVLVFGVREEQCFFNLSILIWKHFSPQK